MNKTCSCIFPPRPNVGNIKPKTVKKLPFYFFTLPHARRFYSIHTRQFNLSKGDPLGVKRQIILHCIMPDYFTLSNVGWFYSSKGVILLIKPSKHGRDQLRQLYIHMSPKFEIQHRWSPIQLMPSPTGLNLKLSGERQRANRVRHPSFPNSTFLLLSFFTISLYFVFVWELKNGK